ncbi:unnamed protein product, partial [Chrysoparadoxa australica]
GLGVLVLERVTRGKLGCNMKRGLARAAQKDTIRQAKPLPSSCSPVKDTAALEADALDERIDAALREANECLEGMSEQEVLQFRKRQAKAEAQVNALQGATQALAVDGAIAQAELHKAQQLKVKLERLCRTLQSEGKAMELQSRQKAKDDRARREAIGSDVESTINKLDAKVTEMRKQTEQQRAENADLRGRLEMLKKSHMEQGKKLEELQKVRREGGLQPLKEGEEDGSSRLVKVREACSKQVEEYELKIASIRSEVIQFEDEEVVLREKIAEMKELLGKAAAQKQQWEAELPRARQLVSELEEENRALNKAAASQLLDYLEGSKERKVEKEKLLHAVARLEMLKETLVAEVTAAGGVVPEQSVNA